MVGLGGIGSCLADLFIPVLGLSKNPVEIHLMDNDFVEESNIAHQKFSREDIGKAKAIVIANRYSHLEKIKLIPRVEKLLQLKQLIGYDIIVVAVDNNYPRELVHSSGVPWADLRCQGDGWIFINHQTDTKKISPLPIQTKPTSCQLPGAISSGNIEFGFAAAAAVGAQWLNQQLRSLQGVNTRLPNFFMGYLTYGQMNI